MGEFEDQAAVWNERAPSYNEASLGLAWPVAEVLVKLADGGHVLELGIGAGRVALPLARRGVTVTGLDASTDMIRRLIERRGDLPVEVRITYMAAFDVPNLYPLIYVVSSTCYLLTTRDRQMSRLHCCARALSDGGRLVIEAVVPGSSALPLESGIFVRAVGQDYAKVFFVAHDPVTQALRSQEVQLDAEGMRLRHVTRRYTHLPDLDLMASVAELRLEGRPSG
ncbi:class I SAM-dependent methyltransferase [Streptomyces sp. NPDC001222]|uniref:class I SAM-dependent methyltransferase n=1 Tax=Streptomyces sp. NPDC001222 TaxID=3364548 RepID=UPI00369C917A